MYVTNAAIPYNAGEVFYHNPSINAIMQKYPTTGYNTLREHWDNNIIEQADIDSIVQIISTLDARTVAGYVVQYYAKAKLLTDNWDVAFETHKCRDFAFDADAYFAVAQCCFDLVDNAKMDQRYVHILTNGLILAHVDLENIEANINDAFHIRDYVEVRARLI